MKMLKKILKSFGPGFITGASDDDPSGIATYSQTGAQFGYSQLWTALFSFPLMTVVQEMCGRIGLVTGKGLSGVIRTYYSKKLLFFCVALLIVANTINIGADLGAMAASAQLLIGFPFIMWLLIMTIVTLLLEVFVPYPTYAQFLKYLTFSLLAYIIVGLIIHQDWLKVARSTFIPQVSFSADYFMNIIAILGTTISPYLFFWQADEEVEEEIIHHKLVAMGRGVPKISKKDITEMRIDTTIGMFFSQLVMFFIILAVAATLGVHNITTIQTADQAAQALRPIAGNFAYLLFAAGILGTGLLAVPILAGSASYAVAEALKWNAGLNKKFSRAQGFYSVLAVATIIGLVVNFTPVSPFQMLYYTAVINGLCAPPLIIMLLIICNNKKIMGKHTNSKFSNYIGILAAIVMSLAAVALLYTTFVH